MGMNPGGGQVLVSKDLLEQTQVGRNEFHVELAQPDDTRREGPQMAPGKAKPPGSAFPGWIKKTWVREDSGRTFNYFGR